jgi:hypothetical protein
METGFMYGVKTISDVIKARQEEFNQVWLYQNRMRFMQAIGMISEENLAEVNDCLQPQPSQGNKK